jgi:hypothetical protein
MADKAPFVEGGCVNRQSNRLRSSWRLYKEKDPSSKPMATLWQVSAVSEESIAMDIGSRKVSVSVTARDVVANNCLSFLELHARRPETESAAIIALFDIMASRGGSGGLSATTISLTAHCP